MLSESQIQAKLIERLEGVLPGCVILKNDPNYMRGVPDLSVFFGEYWAWLEVKRSENAPPQPNQEHWIRWAKENSYGAFVWMENMEEIIDEIQRSFHVIR